MLNGFRDYFTYDPSSRAAAISLMGSSFVLFLFLTSPDFENQYYLFGVVTMVFAILSSVVILAFDQRS